MYSQLHTGISIGLVIIQYTRMTTKLKPVVGQSISVKNRKMIMYTSSVCIYAARGR